MPVTLRSRYAFPSMRLNLLLAVLLASASCSDDLGDPTGRVEGAYMLMMVRNEPLPARAACGGYQLQSVHLGLGPGRQAFYQMWMLNEQSGQTITYDGVGSFRLDGDVVTIDVTGPWSASGQHVKWRMQFEVVRDGVLVRRNVGAECDASDTEIYERGTLILL
jgi:hypothetical protein